MSLFDPDPCVEPEPDDRDASRHPAGPVHVYTRRVYADDGGRTLPLHHTACGLVGPPYTGAGSDGLRTAVYGMWADCPDCLAAPIA